MIFNENESKVITIPNYENVFVYFLIKNNEVVYVGQTKVGLSRPLAHKKDKDFDEIKIIYCDEKDIDLIEDTFIQKYKPIYNKQNNYAIRYNLERVRNMIRKRYNIKNYNIPQLKKVLKELGIEPINDIYTNKLSVNFEEVKIIMNYGGYIK